MPRTARRDHYGPSPQASARRYDQIRRRPVLAWENAESCDLQGIVVWRMRVAARYLAEAHAVAPHGVRLLMWEDRGRGPLVFEHDGYSLNDPPDKPDLADVAEWAALLEGAAHSMSCRDAHGEPWPT